MDEPYLDRLSQSLSPAIHASATRSVPVLTRALKILELLAASPNGLTLPDVSRKLEIAKSSAHCILLTLMRHGYLTRSSQTRRYVLGTKLFSLAHQASPGQLLREKAIPHLRQLMLTTNLTVHMGIFEGEEVVLVAKLDPPGVTPVATWLGRRMEVHCTAVGKALIAHLPPDDLQQLLRTRSFPRHNDNTVVSAKRLQEQLEAVRRMGYATDDEEEEIGYRCLGVPVFDDGGALVAAISVAGSVAQVMTENMNELIRQLTRTAKAIQGALGT